MGWISLKIKLRGLGDTNLAASLTHMGLFTRVHSRVYCQGGALDKLLSAARPVTGMGPDSSVDSLYSHKSSVLASGAKEQATYHVARDHCVEQIPCCK